MKNSILYGKEKITINVKEQVETVKPNDIKIEDEETVLKKGFLKPINKEHIDEFVSNSEKLLIIVNDGTRPTPTSKILEYLSPILLNHEDLSFIVACGSHKKPTDEEFKRIFGKCFDKFSDRVYVHDARDKNQIYVGKTSRGTKVGFNKKIFEAKNVISINSVEPHYFAGYTGGRKTFLPGVAAYDTIEMNHKFALKKEACALALKGNPIHEDMTEAVNFLKEINIFSIQVVLTPKGEMYKVTTGDLHKSFDKAVEYANNIFCTKIKQKGNIVLTVAPPPLDINLYQSQKALENGKLALEKDGIIILVSKCPQGIGPEEFMNLLTSAESPEQVLKKIEKGYKLGYHKAAKIAELSTRADIWAVTSIKEDEIKKAFIKPYKDLNIAVEDAIKTIKTKGEKPRIIILPYGSLTVPFISDS